MEHGTSIAQHDAVLHHMQQVQMQQAGQSAVPAAGATGQWPPVQKPFVPAVVLPSPYAELAQYSVDYSKLQQPPDHAVPRVQPVTDDAQQAPPSSQHFNHQQPAREQDFVYSQQQHPSAWQSASGHSSGAHPDQQARVPAYFNMHSNMSPSATSPRSAVPKELAAISETIPQQLAALSSSTWRPSRPEPASGNQSQMYSTSARQESPQASQQLHGVQQQADVSEQLNSLSLGRVGARHASTSSHGSDDWQLLPP